MMEEKRAAQSKKVVRWISCEHGKAAHIIVTGKHCFIIPLELW